MLFLAERALFRADCAPNVLYSVVCCSCSPHAHMASWDLMRGSRLAENVSFGRGIAYRKPPHCVCPHGHIGK